MYSEVYIETVFVRIEMSGDKLFHTGNAHTSFYAVPPVRVAVSQRKRVEMGVKVIEMGAIYGKVYNEII